MKKHLLAALLCTSSSAMAAPYVGLDLGLSTFSHDYQTHFSADNKTVSPDDSGMVLNGYVGYRWGAFGLELGYRHFDELDGSSSQFMGNVDGFRHEREWDADLKVSQITLKPVYFYTLTDRVELKTGLGLTYTQYDYRSGSSDEYELITNDDIEHNVNRAGGENKKNNEFGVIASVGVDYRIWQQLHIGAGVDYYADSQANAATFMLTSRYQF
ncbi:AcfA family outer membrane beta-barrel protein [Photobacterium damselae subsp. damselae]|uniref:AcfA family outer membrane beta-barrel protein n=1 Tax=Photobacterium damselae TaxID=38293 RepID=UPI00311B3671